MRKSITKRNNKTKLKNISPKKKIKKSIKFSTTKTKSKTKSKTNPKRKVEKSINTKKKMSKEPVIKIEVPKIVLAVEE